MRLLVYTAYVYIKYIDDGVLNSYIYVKFRKMNLSLIRLNNYLPCKIKTSKVGVHYLVINVLIVLHSFCYQNCFKLCDCKRLSNKTKLIGVI